MKCAIKNSQKTTRRNFNFLRFLIISRYLLLGFRNRRKAKNFKKFTCGAENYSECVSFNHLRCDSCAIGYDSAVSN